VQSFEWTEEFSVRIPRVDAEHRRIFDLLRELREGAHGPATEKLLPRAIDELSKYAERHLRREELLLRVRGYPRLAEHKAEHDEYRVKVASLRGQIFRRDIGVRVTNFVDGWWRQHILTSDQDYARYFQRLLK
jgi:hemerythrin